MKNKIELIKTFFLLALIFLIGLSPQVGLAENNESQTYTIGTSGQTKPLNYFEGDELVGYEADIIKEISKRAPHLKFQYEITEFASLFAGLDSGQFDLVMNNLGENEERREKFLFSKYPYVITHNVIITSTEEMPNLTMDDLVGKSFGVVAASPQSQFLESWNEQNPDKKVNIIYQDSDPSGLIQDVYNGRIDATIYSTTYLNDVEKTYGIKLQAHPIENEDAIRIPGSYFIYTNENVELRNEMDAIIAEMREDGTLAEISYKYMDQDDTVLSDELISRNDRFEAERIAEEEGYLSKEEQNNTISDGRIFAPKLILDFLPKILQKLPISLALTLIAGIIGLVLGFAIALIKIRNVAILKHLANIFVSYTRGTPQIVQLFLAYYGLPIIVRIINNGIGTSIDINNIPALVYAFVALGLNQAAFNSETIRAAILSVNPSEILAAKSIGLTEKQTMRRIILPNAMINAVPNLGNSIISLLKGTSLAFTVTVVDMMGQARIIAGANLRFFEAYIGVSIIYWVLCIIIENLIRVLEDKLNVDKDSLESSQSTY